jgi:predicted small secreted protein
MKKMLLCLSLIAGLAACETTKGIGRDVQAAGEALDRTF